MMPSLTVILVMTVNGPAVTPAVLFEDLYAARTEVNVGVVLETIAIRQRRP